jgi:hypothetical protein
MRTTLVLCTMVTSASLTTIGTTSAQYAAAGTSAAPASERGVAPQRGKPKVAARAAASLARKAVPGEGEDVTPPGFTPDDLAKLHGPKQNWYLRSSAIDLGSFAGLYPGAGLGKDPASVSFTDDLLNRGRTATIKALVAYALPTYYAPVLPPPGSPPSLSAAAVAPFVSLDGTLTDPRKPTERSALKAGVDLQAEFAGGGLFSLQDVGLRPYWQTDFRGEGRIAGVQAMWEPYQERWNLGGRFDVAAPKLVGFLWRFVGEVDALRVDKAGLSDYAAHTDYAWVGATLKLRAVLFENLPGVPEWLCGRVVLGGSSNYFIDARSGKSINDNEARVDYDLTPSASSKRCVAATAATPESKEPQLQPSVSFVYDNGIDKSTLEKREKYTISLGMKF